MSQCNIPSFLSAVWLLVACAHREKLPVGDRVPFDQRLINFQSLHNSARIKELRAYFTKDAMIQSPLTPRAASPEKYLQALAAEPYYLAFSRTEVVYSLPRRAATRSDVVASAAGRFNLKERVTVDWRVEDGYWRISRILFSDWSPMVGTWRHSGLNREGIDRTSRPAGWKLSCFPRGGLLGARVPWKLSPGGQ